MFSTRGRLLSWQCRHHSAVAGGGAVVQWCSGAVVQWYAVVQWCSGSGMRRVCGCGFTCRQLAFGQYAS